MFTNQQVYDLSKIIRDNVKGKRSSDTGVRMVCCLIRGLLREGLITSGQRDFLVGTVLKYRDGEPVSNYYTLVHRYYLKRLYGHFM